MEHPVLRGKTKKIARNLNRPLLPCSLDPKRYSVFDFVRTLALRRTMTWFALQLGDGFRHQCINNPFLLSESKKSRDTYQDLGIFLRLETF